MAATITKPGYWFIWGHSTSGAGSPPQAGVVLFSDKGNLPNATGAIFIDAADAASLNMTRLNNAIQQSKQTWLYQIPATGTHNDPQSIGARAVGQGSALYNWNQVGVQATNDLTFLALLIGVGVGIKATTGAGGAAAEGGAAGGATSTAISTGAKALGSDISTLGGSLTGLASVGALAALIADPNFWLRIAEFIGGVVLLFVGIKSLGQTSGAKGVGIPDRPIRTQARRASGRIRLQQPSERSPSAPHPDVMAQRQQKLDIESRKVAVREGKLQLAQPKPGKVTPVE